MTTTTTTTTTADTLVGLFFHSFTPGDHPRQITRQGRIHSEPVAGHYLIQELDWLIGGWDGALRLVPFAEMAEWNLYATAVEMNDWYRHHYQGD